MICLKILLLGLWLMLLVSLLVSLALFGVRLGEVWQGRVGKAEKVRAVKGCVCMFWEIELMWQ